MDSLLNLARNLLESIGNMNARLLEIIRLGYEQLVSLFPWPVMRNQVTCLVVQPQALSPVSVSEERVQDEPEDEYTIRERVKAEAAHQMLAAVVAMKVCEKNLKDAVQAGKRCTFGSNDEITELEQAVWKAEDVVMDALSYLMKLHIRNCDDCHRIIDDRCTTVQVLYKRSEQKLALAVKEPPRKLLAITWKEDTPCEEISHELDKCKLLALPAPEICQQILELAPCQMEKKAIQAKVGTPKKKSPQVKPRPRWR